MTLLLGIFTKLCSVIYIVKYLFIMVLIIYFIDLSAKSILDVSINPILLCGLLFFLGLAIGKCKTEIRCRLSEVLFYVVLIPLLLLIATTIFKVEPANIINRFFFALPPKETILTINTFPKLILFSIFMSMIIFPIEIIIPLKIHVKKDTDIYKPICGSILASGGFNLILFFIIVGIYGNISNVYSPMNLFSLFKLCSINGVYNGRLYAVAIIYIFISLTFALGFYSYYEAMAIRMLLPRLNKLVFIIPMLVALIFSFNLFAKWDSFTPSSPENRVMVMSIYINKEKNIIFEIYNESGNLFYNTHHNNIDDALTYFKNNNSQNLDLSHTGKIVIAKNHYDNLALLSIMLFDYKYNLAFPDDTKVTDDKNPRAYMYLYQLYN